MYHRLHIEPFIYTRKNNSKKKTIIFVLLPCRLCVCCVGFDPCTKILRIKVKNETSIIS